MADEFCREFVWQKGKYRLEAQKTRLHSKPNRMSNADYVYSYMVVRGYLFFCTAGYRRLGHTVLPRHTAVLHVILRLMRCSTSYRATTRYPEIPSRSYRTTTRCFTSYRATTRYPGNTRHWTPHRCAG